MNQQSDLFGESPRIRIAGNPLLEGIANHILDLVQRQPWLLDGTVGEIDKKLWVSLALDNDLRSLIPNENQRAEVTKFLISKNCPDEEAISRARRYLLERDFIRVSSEAIKQAESHRERIARSVKR